MRIAIDLSAVATAGTQNYTAGFGPAILKRGAKHQFLIFGSAPTWGLISGGDPPPNAEWAPAFFRHTAFRVAWEQTVLPWKLRRWNADVCFSPFDTAPFAAPCPVLLAVRSPMPTLALSGAGERPGLLARDRAHFFVSSRACRKASKVFYPTAFAANLLSHALGVPKEKRAVVFHGTDRDFWQARGDKALIEHWGLKPERYVLFVSRLYPQKRADVLIDAFAEWRKAQTDPSWRLVFVGTHVSAGKEAEFREQVARLGLDTEVLSVWDIERERLRALYQNAAVFVLPTEMETFGQPFVEALASGAPIVAADRGFARELCEDAAIYFPAGDVNALAAAIGRVTSDPQLRTAMIAKGRQRSEAFSWNREAAETLALLEEVASR